MIVAECTCCSGQLAMERDREIAHDPQLRKSPRAKRNPNTVERQHLYSMEENPLFWLIRPSAKSIRKKNTLLKSCATKRRSFVVLLITNHRSTDGFSADKSSPPQLLGPKL
jgi:hypothetical protein